MRTYYSDYVQHCMRFYARHPNPKFNSDAEKQNWNACDSALKRFDNSERDILLTVYREGDTLADNIYNYSVEHGINQDKVWKLLNKLEKMIAKRRGLL